MVYLAIAVFIAAIGFVFWRLHVTNMEIPASAEKRLGARDALRFALDNSIPVKAADCDDRIYTEGPNRGYPKDVY